MAESVDALVSNTSGANRAGSTPALGTKKFIWLIKGQAGDLNIRYSELKYNVGLPREYIGSNSKGGVCNDSSTGKRR